ncbi:MAG: DNA repair protein RecO [Catalinimonas sp.]
MLEKTRGVVLSTLPYRETSVISRIYTEDFGRQSFLMNGVRRAAGKRVGPRAALFQPLTPVALVTYFRPGRDLHRLSEIQCFHPYRTLPLDFRKTGIALFLAEVLDKSVREEEPQPALFTFIFDGLRRFDNLAEGFGSFHLQFLLGLSRYLGFRPSSSEDFYGQLFDTAAWRQIVGAAEAEALDALLQSPYEAAPPLPSAVRRGLLDHLVKFYALHVANFGELRSLPVLQETMG